MHPDDWAKARAAAGGTTPPGYSDDACLLIRALMVEVEVLRARSDAGWVKAADRESDYWTAEAGRTQAFAAENDG